MEANLVINLHPTDLNQFWLGHRQPRVVTYAAWISLLQSLVALQQLKNYINNQRLNTINSWCIYLTIFADALSTWLWRKLNVQAVRTCSFSHLQSTFTLRAPGYDQLPIVVDRSWSPGEEELHKITPTITHSLYYRYQIWCPLWQQLAEYLNPFTITPGKPQLMKFYINKKTCNPVKEKFKFTCDSDIGNFPSIASNWS